MTLKCAIESVLVGCVTSVIKLCDRVCTGQVCLQRRDTVRAGSYRVHWSRCFNSGLRFEMCLNCCTEPPSGSHDHASAERKHPDFIPSLPACVNLPKIENRNLPNLWTTKSGQFPTIVLGTFWHSNLATSHNGVRTTKSDSWCRKEYLVSSTEDDFDAVVVHWNLRTDCQHSAGDRIPGSTFSSQLLFILIREVQNI